MPEFTSIDDLLKYVANNSHVVFEDDNIRKVLAEAMSIAVQDVVYDVYDPRVYLRRGEKGGLADPDNLQFIKTELNGGVLRVVFENVTKGQTHQLPIYEHNFDSLHNETISETIEFGYKKNWYETGRWSEARPFMQETVKRLEANPTPLINAIKKAYRDAGFDVK